MTFRSGMLGKPQGSTPADGSTDLTAMMQKIALDEFTPKTAVIDENGQVLTTSPNINKYLNFSGGPPQTNIIKLAASGLRIGLRAAIAEAKQTMCHVEHENLSLKVDDMIQPVMLTVQPMPQLGEDEPLYLVVFHDVGLPIERRSGTRQDFRPDSSGTRQDFRPSNDETLDDFRFKGKLRFDIIDTGIGMSDQQKAKLFKPFSQGDSSVSRHFGGTGLGLAISRRLAKMLGGNIRSESTLGKGSKFSVSIKTGSIENVEFVEPSLVIEAPPSTSPSENDNVLACRVLVVDDRRDIRFLSKRLLSKAGAIVDECEDGQLAVDYITECLHADNCPDLILLDMQMPNLDGYETARELRKLGYNGPVIALTADAMQGVMNECIQAGCNDYLSKPIDAARLVQLVKKLT